MLSERSSSLAVTPLTLRTMLTRDLASRAIRYIRQEAPRRECDPPFRPHCNGLIDGRCCSLVPAAIFWFTSITSFRARDADFRFALTSGSYRGRNEIFPELMQSGKPLIRSPRPRVQRKADRHVEAERLGRFGLGASWYLVGR